MKGEGAHIIGHESTITHKEKIAVFLLTLRFPPLTSFIGRVKRTLSLGIESMPLNSILKKKKKNGWRHSLGTELAGHRLKW